MGEGISFEREASVILLKSFFIFLSIFIFGTLIQILPFISDNFHQVQLRSLRVLAKDFSTDVVSVFDEGTSRFLWGQFIVEDLLGLLVFRKQLLSLGYVLIF